MISPEKRKTQSLLPNQKRTPAPPRPKGTETRRTGPNRKSATGNTKGRNGRGNIRELRNGRGTRRETDSVIETGTDMVTEGVTNTVTGTRRGRRSGIPRRRRPLRSGREVSSLPHWNLHSEFEFKFIVH